MDARSGSRAGPEPGPRVRLDEQVDFLRRQLETARMEVGEGLHGFDDESNPEVFVGEQPVDDDADRLLRHGCLPVSPAVIHSRQYAGHKQRATPIGLIPFVQSQFSAQSEFLVALSVLSGASISAYRCATGAESGPR